MIIRPDTPGGLRQDRLGWHAAHDWGEILGKEALIMGEQSGQVDRASRVILATPRQLFRTYFETETLKAWRVPDGAIGSYTVLEPHPGGRYCLNILYPERSEINGPEAGIETVTGVFTEFLPDERIVEEIRYANDDPSYAGVMTLTLTIETVQAGSKVTIEAVGMPPALKTTAHRAELSAALRRLALLTE